MADIIDLRKVLLWRMAKIGLRRGDSIEYSLLVRKLKDVEKKYCEDQHCDDARILFGHRCDQDNSL